MDYKQKYEEALERAKTIHNEHRAQCADIMIKVFPELAENEDESIRKWIINEIKIKHHNLDEDNVDFVDKAISWLEKQGNRRIDVEEAMKEVEAKAKAFTAAHQGENADVILAEMRGEESSCDRCRKAQPSHSCSDITALGRCYLEHEKQDEHKGVSQKELDDAYLKGINDAKNEIEKQEEQKFVITEPEKYCKGVSAPVEATAATYTTEVETGDGGIKALVTEKVLIPKFKVGDWITNGYVGGQITSIEDNYPCYKIAHFMGGINTSIPFTLQDDYHLWSIQDAKAGDVLASKDKEDILIYKSNSEIELLLTSHISFSKKEGFCPRQYSAWDGNEFIPATKEQRDLLFQKMKEEGYEWDAEKKELKKIEQKPVDWSEEDEIHFNDAIYAIQTTYSKQCGQEELIAWLKKIKEYYVK